MGLRNAAAKRKCADRPLAVPHLSLQPLNQAAFEQEEGHAVISARNMLARFDGNLSKFI
jgi:hypothetical protein